MRQTRSQGAEGLNSGDTVEKLPGKQKRSKLAEENLSTEQIDVIVPTQREIAAAEAARARLCGGRGQSQVQPVSLCMIAMQITVTEKSRSPPLPAPTHLIQVEHDAFVAGGAE